jgi:hypothetical protein
MYAADSTSNERSGQMDALVPMWSHILLALYRYISFAFQRKRKQGQSKLLRSGPRASITKSPSMCTLFYMDIDHINPEDETERLVVWSLSLSSWGLRPGLTRLVISTILRIDPYLGSLLHRWVMGIVITTNCTVSHGPFTPIDTGLRMRLLRGTRSTNGRDNAAP